MVEYIIQNKHYKDVNPTEFGSEQCRPGKSVGPAIRDYYLIHFVVSGKGNFFCDNTSYPVSAGQFFVIRPHESTIYVADEEDPWQYIWVAFSGSATESCDFLKKRVVDYGGNVFYEMLDIEFYESSREEFLVSKIFLLMAEFAVKKFNTSHYVKLTKDYIRSEYMKDIKLSTIANAIGIDRCYLSKLFKAQTKMTFQEFLISTRMKKANEFLNKGYNVTETAYMCGYKEPCVFSRAYKKYYHFSPTEYINHYANTES